MRYLLPFAFLLFYSFPAQPCGNEYGHTLEGEKVYSLYFYITPDMETFNEEYIKKRLSELESKVALYPGNFKNWSDIALNLMKLGQADSAIAILRPLLKVHGNEYNVLANLGTAYELVGELDSALKYISKGLEVNPRSHRGSEWIHVKILEAKLKEKREPGWLHTNAIIEISELEARKKDENDRNWRRRMDIELSYQLRTRAPFTPAPNRVMANLLITLGDFNVAHGTYENALLAYANALVYQDHHSVGFRIKERIKELNRKRSDLSAPIELEPTFKWMMERGKVDPELLVLGLRQYSMTIDSFARKEQARKDSFNMLQARLDSSEKRAEEQKLAAEAVINEEQKRGNTWWPSFLVGLLAGAFVVWGVFKMRRK